MGCDISREQLWSWVDREAPELEDHVATCPRCRELATEIRDEIALIAAGAVPPEIPVPERIGDYVVKRLIGEGGQALVYEAEQAAPARPVALKVLKGGRFAGRNRLKRFVRETQTLARLRHPAIATIFETGHTEEGQHFFAMELVDGVALDGYVQNRRPSRPDVLRLLAGICDAVDHAHRHDVIHRDLKPSNILVDEDGDPHILDFGLARIMRPDLPLASMVTAPGMIEGTPRYMSPEQARGETDAIDARTDVYSLGVIGYELLTGVPPYDLGGDTREMVRTICEQPPTRPSDRCRELRGDLDTILLKALEKDPSRRYGSAAELADDLRRHLDGDPILARPASPLYVLGKKLRKRRLRAALAVVVLAVVLVGAIRSLGPDYDVTVVRRRALELRCQLIEDGSNGRAVQSASTFYSRYRDLPEALLLHTHAIYLSREPRSAIGELELALAADPTRWDCRRLLYEILSNQGVHQERPPPPPRTADAYYLDVFTTLDMDTALARAREALRLDPHHRLALEADARLSELAGDLDGALAAVARLIEAGSGQIRWLQIRAELYLSLERYDEALAACDALVAAIPTSDAGYILRGSVRRQRRDYQGAIEDLTMAIELRQSDRRAAWVYHHRGTPLWILGRAEQAAGDYAAASRLLTHPTFGDARRYLILHELGRPDEAAAVLAAARAGLRDHPWLERVLAGLAGEVAPADLVDEAAATLIQRCEGYYYAGEICRLQGRTEAAAAWFRRCLATGLRSDPGAPTNPMSEYELAEWRLGGLGAAD